VGFLVVMTFIVMIMPENKVRLKSPHFTYIFSQNIDTAEIWKLARALENNYSRISNDLETIPAENIEVNVYSYRWNYIKATRNWTASGNIEGTAKLHFLEKSWGEDDSKKVAVHEFTHAVVLKLLIDHERQPLNAPEFDKKFSHFPVWLWEGVSVYEAGQFIDPKTLAFLNNNSYPGFPELDTRSKGAKIYKVGYTIIEYILQEYGKLKLIELIKNYGNVQLVLNVSDEQFCKNWFGFVKRKYL